MHPYRTRPPPLTARTPGEFSTRIRHTSDCERSGAGTALVLRLGRLEVLLSQLAKPVVLVIAARSDPAPLSLVVVTTRPVAPAARGWSAPSSAMSRPILPRR